MDLSMLLSRRQAGSAFFSLLGVGALVSAFPAWAIDDDIDWPNVFISPHGKPFRAKAAAPYPMGDWFREADKNGDGKLDHAEFLADAEAFFDVLDLNKDGRLGRMEILVYEHNIAPEILGGRIYVGERDGARLWLAQVPSMDVEPSQPETPENPGDQAAMGAIPYSLFEEPEPVMTADFNVDGLILKKNFLKVADDHFTALDVSKAGYVTFDKLHKTPVQKVLRK
jgi:hypothetical protein